MINGHRRERACLFHDFLVDARVNPTPKVERVGVFLPVIVASILFGIGWSPLGDSLIDAMNPHQYRTNLFTFQYQV